jgi:hypothetical protein
MNRQSCKKVLLDFALHPVEIEASILGTNGKIQKEQQQTEAQPHGA